MKELEDLFNWVKTESASGKVDRAAFNKALVVCLRSFFLSPFHSLCPPPLPNFSPTFFLSLPFPFPSLSLPSLSLLSLSSLYLLFLISTSTNIFSGFPSNLRSGNRNQRQTNDRTIFFGF
jgi:hypothetical protein